MIYLASPYTDPDPHLREQRFQKACQAAVQLLRRGHVVFSPIVHGHPLTERGLPGTWTFWERIDRVFLERCDAVVVLMLDGWRESRGVQAEIQLATELGKPVWYFAPASLTAGYEATPWPATLAHVAEEVSP